MKVSAFYRLGKTQPQLDFVDVDVSRDTRLFVDPYAIEIRDDELSQELGHHVVTFFQEILNALRARNNFRARYLTENLHEPQETFLGLSRGRPQGRGVGRSQADQLLASLLRSRAFQTGVLSDLAETELFIDYISSDKISDLTTNVIRSPLIRYTQDQCNLHGIPLRQDVPVGPTWNPDELRWEQNLQNLPVVRGKPVIFIPKIIVRLRLSLDSQEFYNHHVLNYLRAEHLDANSGLVRLLRNGSRVVYKKDLKRINPFSKDFLADFVARTPNVLEAYKSFKGAQGALTNKDFENDLNEKDLALSLIEALKEIPPGTQHADRYHSLMIGILEFLFYPQLTHPRKEERLHQGRKRIDIVYTNSGTSGFWELVRTSPQTRARYVIIECKNYSEDLGNPEFDQLTGRFGHVRGFFGIITCRANTNKEAALNRSRDAANDGRGIVLVVEDEDVCSMLASVAAGKRSAIPVFLDREYRGIVF